MTLLNALAKILGPIRYSDTRIPLERAPGDELEKYENESYRDLLSARHQYLAKRDGIREKMLDLIVKALLDKLGLAEIPEMFHGFYKGLVGTFYVYKSSRERISDNGWCEPSFRVTEIIVQYHIDFCPVMQNGVAFRRGYTTAIDISKHQLSQITLWPADKEWPYKDADRDISKDDLEESRRKALQS